MTGAFSVSDLAIARTLTWAQAQGKVRLPRAFMLHVLHATCAAEWVSRGNGLDGKVSKQTRQYFSAFASVYI